MDRVTSVPANVKSVIYERVVQRADGTVEVLPPIRWHRNPLVRVLWSIQDRRLK